ncbi:MAG: hypothetical protein ABRQ39_14525 [Candidatus Eremiobacterota bacterium]
MNSVKSSLENIRSLRKQKLNELLFPCFGAFQERLIYGGSVHAFIENGEPVGYYIVKNSEILDFYVKKEYDYFADECFCKALEELSSPVVNIRSDDSLLINLVFNYLIDLEKGGYLLVRDRRHILPEIDNSSLRFSPLSIDIIEECCNILSAVDYGGGGIQKDILHNSIDKDIYFCLLEDSTVTGIGYHQPVRNNCSEIRVIMNREYNNNEYAILLLAELARLVENKGYKCFAEVSRFDTSDRKLMEELGFYVIAKYFTAIIKGRIEDNTNKRRFNRRYSLTGLFKVL